MRILGIDPGIARVGWGTIEVESGKLKVENHGCIETSAKQSMPDRLLEIHNSISSLLEQYKPEVVVVEEVFFGTNAKTALSVGQARGVVLLASAEHGVSVVTYTPLQVKIAVTGYGRAEKHQVGRMVKTLLKLKEIPKPDDVSDALAIALTHAFSMRINSQIT